MRLLSLFILAFIFLSRTIALGEEAEDHTHAFKTYQGTLGLEPVVVEFAFARTPEGISGRYSYPSVGKDIPLYSSNETTEQKSAGSDLTFIEEAPCTPKTCQSIVPERDDEFSDIAPGEAPKAAVWQLKFDESGKTITGVRKDLKTGNSQTVSLNFDGKIEVEFDCCSPDSLLRTDYKVDDNMKSMSYDVIKSSVPFKPGPVKTFGNATYHMEKDDRIGSSFPSMDSLPGGGDVKTINEWLRLVRSGLYAGDFNCASRNYHGFRWNKAMSKKLQNYTAKTKASIDFVSDKLIGITETIDVDCGGHDTDKSKLSALGDVKSGKRIDPKTLIEGYEYKDPNGDPVSPADPYASLQPSQKLIDKLITAIRENGDEDYVKCFDKNSLWELTVAFRGDQMAFTFTDRQPGYLCYDDVLTMPLSKGGDYLNDKGKAYFAEFLK